MSNDTVQAIEQNIRDAKEIIELNKALERLSQNPDFKKVIKVGYFEKEAIRLVHLKSDPNMKTDERQQSILASIDAIGGLSDYFRTVAFNASVAAKAIESDEAVRDEILAEELAK
jgi:hypothetical protein